MDRLGGLPSIPTPTAQERSQGALLEIYHPGGTLAQITRTQRLINFGLTVAILGLLVVITGALLLLSERLVRLRERRFVASMSHELRTPVDVKKLVREVVDSLRLPARETKSMIEFSVGDVPQIIESDATALRIIMDNLLLNALHHGMPESTNPNRRVQLRVEAEDHVLLIVVEDHGEGVGSPYRCGRLPDQTLRNGGVERSSACAAQTRPEFCTRTVHKGVRGLHVGHLTTGIASGRAAHPPQYAGVPIAGLPGSESRTRYRPRRAPRQSLGLRVGHIDPDR